MNRHFLEYYKLDQIKTPEDFRNFFIMFSKKEIEAFLSSIKLNVEAFEIVEEK